MKLHLGCGKRYIPGYVHIDVSDYPHIDLRYHIDRIPMIEDGAASVIYVCHALEHFHRRDTVRVLQEWYRILCPGGVLRIAVPDFEALIDLYQEKRDLGLVIGPLYGRQDYVFNVHYTTFDFETLKLRLIEAGFINIERYDWRKTDHSDIDDYSQSYYPHMQKDTGKLLSLNVEAYKP